MIQWKRTRFKWSVKHNSQKNTHWNCLILCRTKNLHWWAYYVEIPAKLCGKFSAMFAICAIWNGHNAYANQLWWYSMLKSRQQRNKHYAPLVNVCVCRIIYFLWSIRSISSMSTVLNEPCFPHSSKVLLSVNDVLWLLGRRSNKISDSFRLLRSFHNRPKPSNYMVNRVEYQCQ